MKILDFNKYKKNGNKISMVTAYDYSFAKLVEKSGIDCILVGDSLGMTMLGYKDTLSVTVDDIIHHTKAVMRGVSETFVIADMPFLSYHVSDEDAIRNAGRIIKETGANAVKLEGGVEMLTRISAIVGAKIPVMGHIGLTPQSINILGGFKVQGKLSDDAKKIIEDAKALQRAGCFAIVLEAIPSKLAEMISSELDIPTIGIGAGAGCDGQVLVIQDLLGLFDDFKPKFVKRYANLGEDIVEALQSFKNEVQTGDFPQEQHGFSISDDELKKLY